MNRQRVALSSSRGQPSSTNEEAMEELSPADEKLIEKYETLLKGWKRLPARIDHRRSLMLRKARDEMKKPAAFARLLEKIGMTQNEADKRLINARSERINSQEFQSQMLPRVVGYSTLTVIASMKEEAYARLHELPPDAKITKAVIESVAHGNPPIPKLLSALTVKFGEKKLVELTPAQQEINRKIISDVLEPLGREGSIFQYTLRKDLLKSLGHTSSDAQSKEATKE